MSDAPAGGGPTPGVPGDELGQSVDIEVPATLDGERIDRTVALLTGVPRRVAAELVTTGAVRVDGVPVTTRSTALRTGQRLEIFVPAPEGAGPRPDPTVSFGVVYEDDDLVVVDKPAGLVVHHGAGHRQGTLVDGLVARFPDLVALGEAGIGDPARPGIVHRLDKGTSGLLVVARSSAAFATLSEQLREHRAERRYVALVAGTVRDDQGIVDAPIGRSARRPDRMTVRAGGRPARTRYTVRTRFDEPVPATLLEATLDTGRTHQVRVHLAALGTPVVGDDRYGETRARPRALVDLLTPGRLFLHAWRLSVDHPDGRRLSWESPVPADLERVLAALS